MGMIARSAPQLNIFAVGFPMTLLLGLVLLRSASARWRAQFENMLETALLHAREHVGSGTDERKRSRRRRRPNPDSETPRAGRGGRRAGRRARASSTPWR
jgi:hypothetical protein